MNPSSRGRKEPEIPAGVLLLLGTALPQAAGANCTKVLASRSRKAAATSCAPGVPFGRKVSRLYQSATKARNGSSSVCTSTWKTKTVKGGAAKGSTFCTSSLNQAEIGAKSTINALTWGGRCRRTPREGSSLGFSCEGTRTK